MHAGAGVSPAGSRIGPSLFLAPCLRTTLRALLLSGDIPEDGERSEDVHECLRGRLARGYSPLASKRRSFYNTKPKVRLSQLTI